MIKKTLLFLTAVSLLLITSFTSCEKDKKDVDKPITNSERRHTLSREMAEKIMNAFIDKDEVALYSLMSTEAKDFPLTKEQIRETFKFFDGEIISYNLPERAGLISTYISSDIKSVLTVSGNEYQISFKCLFIDDNPKNDIDGVRSIIVGLRDEKYLFIEYIVIGIEDNDFN